MLVALAVVPALAPPGEAAASIPAGHGARIAIVIDDVVNNARLGQFLAIRAPLTFAVVPFTSTSVAASHRVAARGDEVIVHLPITLRRVGARGTVLGRGGSAGQVEAWVGRALATVPNAVGANNHAGATTDVATKKALMAALVTRGLFFLDNVTVPNSVAYAAAVRAGMPPRVNNGSSTERRRPRPGHGSLRTAIASSRWTR